MENQSKNGNIIAIITMMFLYAMISFVTNLAAPIGVIWKNVFADSGSANMIGMLGNAMNFLAYLFMGIPAGKLLTKIGYKKTALTGIATGFVGVLIQFLSGKFGADISGFAVYLFGAFISGFAVCILNTVVNPMLNLIGGGGNRGNQLNLIGGTLNSLSGTLTPMLVGALIGTVTANTKMVDVNLVLYIALAVFAAAFVILNFIPIQDPEMGKTTDKTVFEHSPWAFRHFNLGVIAIFVYVGVEVGIPGTLNFYISDTTANGGGFINGTALANAAAIGGFVAGTYWLLMLVGRLCSSFIADKVSSRMMMMIANGAGMIFIVLAVLLGKSTTVEMPVFTGTSFQMVTVPIAAMFLVLCGLCTSIMWSSIFNLATEGLGKYTAQASGIFMMMVVGGGLMPLVQNFIADNAGYMASYIVPLICMAYFKGTPAHASAAEIAFAVGMLLGGVILSIWGGFKKRRYTIGLSVLLMGVSNMLSGLLPPDAFLVFVVCCTVMGISAPFYGVQNAIFQETVKPEYLGRVFSLLTSAASLAMPFGLVISGPLAERLGVEKWFVICGIGIIIVALAVFLLPGLREIDNTQ